MSKKEHEQINPFAQNKQDTNNENEENCNITENNTEENNQQEQAIKEEPVESKEKAELDQLKNQYVRLAADFDNYRKRQSQERESLLKYGAETTLKLLLPVLDTYTRGKKACENIEDIEKLRENVEVVFKQLFDALDKAGLKKIETEGKEFDPNLHEVVMRTATSEQPENTIVEELQSGYMLEDRVLRPAMVSVAVSE